jgi:hypothetical protein
VKGKVGVVGSESAGASILLAQVRVTEDGLIDGATLQAAPEEEQGYGGEEEIGAPGSERGRELAGIPEGEKDLGTKEHGSDENRSDGYSPGCAATGKDDPKGS